MKRKKIVEKYEKGIHMTSLANMYDNLTVLQRKHLYEEASVANGVAHNDKSESAVSDEVEKPSLAWVSERQMAGYSLPQSITCEKPGALNADLVKLIHQ